VTTFEVLVHVSEMEVHILLEIFFINIRFSLSMEKRKECLSG
jgi:hypothetical protein